MLRTYQSLNDACEEAYVFVGSKRHVTANNKFLPYSVPEEEPNFLVLGDANRFYGWSKMQTLPYKDLMFDNDFSLNNILKKKMKNF